MLYVVSHSCFLGARYGSKIDPLIVFKLGAFVFKRSV